MFSQYSVFLIKLTTSVSLVRGDHKCRGLNENLTMKMQIKITERDLRNTMTMNYFHKRCIYFQLLIRSVKYVDCHFISL